MNLIFKRLIQLCLMATLGLSSVWAQEFVGRYEQTLDSIKELYFTHRFSNTDSAQMAISYGLNLTDSLGQIIDKMNMHIYQATIFQIRADYSNSISAFHRALQLGQSLKLSISDKEELKKIYELIYLTHSGLGNTYNYLNHFHKALASYEQAEAMLELEMLRDLEKREQRLLNIQGRRAAIHEQLGNYTLSEELFLDMLSKYENDDANPRTLASTYLNLSILYLNMDRIEEGLAAVRKARTFLKPDDAVAMAAIDHNSAELMIANDQLDSAFYYGRSGLNYALQLNDKRGESIAYNLIGTAFRVTGQLDSAAFYFEKATSTSRANNLISIAARAVDNLVEIYEELGDNQNLTRSRELALEVQNKLIELDNEAQVDTDTESPQVQTSPAQSDALYWAVAVTVIFLLFFATVLILYRRKQARQDIPSQYFTETAPEAPSETITVRGDLMNEEITVSSKDLLYIQSADNYSEFYVKSEDPGKVEKRILRSTLKKVAEQLPVDYIIRTHKSYIVNLRQIRSIEGNTNSTKAILQVSPPLAVPVSRSQREQVLEAYNNHILKN